MSDQQSLKDAFAAAEKQRDALERGTLGGGGDAVAATLAAYERCAARIDALALFSANEQADDLATAHLRYLLVPLRVAELVQRVPIAMGDEEDLPRARRALLARARDAYERFLHQLDGYGLLGPAYARQLAAYEGDRQHFSMTPSGGGSGGDPIADAAARRNAKIARYREEKALQEKLADLRQQQALRRERRRQLKGNMKKADEDDNNDNDDDNDDASSSYDDDEQTRALALAELAYSAHQALQGLESLCQEDAMLAQVRAADLPRGGARGQFGGLGDGRQRPRGGSEQENTATVPGNGPSLRQLQNMLGTTASVMGQQQQQQQQQGALLTTDGKPRQPFTILGSRAERARAVFQTGHSLPTMSIDEYLEEERRRGGIVEGGGPSSGQAPEPDEDDMARADAETMKARAWDEFTEANPKGAGNTLNRG